MTVDEIRSQREKCADCGGRLEEIYVFQTDESPLHYVSRDVTANWLGQYKPKGSLLAFECVSCARVAFYAAAIDKK
jgi:hypothetical protein